MVVALLLDSDRSGPERTSDLSERVLEAARQLFFARGYSKTQLRAIASEAGTSESGILRAFESKKLLLRAVCESCWADVNRELERALAEAAQNDSDPRSLLLELMRTVLHFARHNKPMMTFLQGHFATPEAMEMIPLDGLSGRVVPDVGREFHRYMNRVGRLCAEVLEQNPGFGKAGVTLLPLTHFVQSAIYGIQASWYQAEQEQTPESEQVSIDEGVTCLACFLYQNAAAPEVGVALKQPLNEKGP